MKPANLLSTGLLFYLILSVGGAYKIRTLARGGKRKSEGLWFAYEGDGEGPSVKYSDDGYWKLVDGDWIPTEKQLSAINDGAVVEEIRPQS